MNFILKTDGYKLSHYNQYPTGTEHVYSYLEARGGKDDFGKSSTVFFGLQPIIIKNFLGQVFFEDDIEYARNFHKIYMPNSHFNADGWYKMLDRYDGCLPIRIKAVPEGSIIPVGNVLMTIENTDKDFPWLTNYIETILSHIWYPITVASQSSYIRKFFSECFLATSDSDSEKLIEYMLHDFGYRGVTCQEQAEIGSAAHLLSFLGSDTLACSQFINRYYPYEYSNVMEKGSRVVIPRSVPASEHSTITSWGRENETYAYRNMLEQYQTGIVACVSDSYDIFNACENIWGGTLKGEVLNRDGTLVIRPDSGNPIEVLPKLLNILGEKFGYTTNSKGFKVLNPKVRLIQGDGIDRNTIGDIVNEVVFNQKWSIENVSFGSGGGLLQNLSRDTMGFAIKCSSITIDGKERDVYKESTSKKSKRGRLSLIRNNDGSFETKREQFNDGNILETVFENGILKKVYSFKDVVSNIHLSKYSSFYL